jgi:hypothetical protein
MSKVIIEGVTIAVCVIGFVLNSYENTLKFIKKEVF